MISRQQQYTAIIHRLLLEADGSPVTTQQVYTAVEASGLLTEHDLRPSRTKVLEDGTIVTLNKQPSWKRNVRCALQAERSKGVVLSHSKGRYMASAALLVRMRGAA